MVLDSVFAMAYFFPRDLGRCRPLWATLGWADLGLFIAEKRGCFGQATMCERVLDQITLGPEI